MIITNIAVQQRFFSLCEPCKGLGLAIQPTIVWFKIIENQIIHYTKHIKNRRKVTINRENLQIFYVKKTIELNFDQKKEGYTLTGRPSFGTGAPNGAPCFICF